MNYDIIPIDQEKIKEIMQKIDALPKKIKNYYLPGTFERISLDYHEAMVERLSRPGGGIGRWVYLRAPGTPAFRRVMQTRTNKKTGQIITRSVMKRTGQRIWHRPSLPGQPPAVLSGRLRSSVREIKSRKPLGLILQVGGEPKIRKALGMVNYAGRLEYKLNRPFFRPVIKLRLPTWIKWLRETLAKATSLKE